MLDVFSYAGGFSVHALANGAKEVTSLDISEQALELAKENGTLNKSSGIHRTIAGDAFEVMKQLINEQKRFDVVVIDPPSFAKRQKEIPNGLLVLASCSARIPAQDFFDINKEALKKQNRQFSIQNLRGHDIDHPITFKEGAYLKCGYYRFRD